MNKKKAERLARSFRKKGYAVKIFTKKGQYQLAFGDKGDFNPRASLKFQRKYDILK